MLLLLLTLCLSNRTQITEAVRMQAGTARQGHRQRPDGGLMPGHQVRSLLVLQLQ